MRCIWLSLALCWSLLTPVSATETAEIDKFLQNPFVKAEFTKERKLKILSRPFVTHGYMLQKPGRGLIWKTTRPIEDTVLIRSDGITQLDARPGAVAIPGNNPVMAAASEMFLAILSRDKGRISALLMQKEQTNDSGKTVFKLVPKDEHLAAIITEVTISGRERVETVEILEKSGDATTIHFMQEVFDASQLTPAEVALFERI